jgi:hypothetical protein
MDTKTAQAILSVIPVVLDLAERVIALAGEVKKSGYVVPDIDALRKQNEKLRALPDL